MPLKHWLLVVLGLPLLGGAQTVHLVPNPFSPHVVAVAEGNAEMGLAVRLVGEKNTPTYARVHVYNTQGTLVRTLSPGVWVTPEGLVLYWNGSDDAGKVVRNGRYMVISQWSASATQAPSKVVRQSVVVFKMTKGWLVFLLCGFVYAGASAPPVLHLESPVLRHYSVEQAQSLEHALRFHLRASGAFQTVLAEQVLLDSLNLRDFWSLRWTVTHKDSLIYLELALSPPSKNILEVITYAEAWPDSLNAYVLARHAVQGLLAPEPHAQSVLYAPPVRPWVAGLFWAGYAGLAVWQHFSVPNSLYSPSSGYGKASSDIPAFFSGLPPLPSLRSTAGAGSARFGNGAIQYLNPAGIVHSHSHVEAAGGALPDGTTEFSAVGVIRAGAGLWQAHSIRFEGDTLAKSWLFMSTWAGDLGYWFSALNGVHLGASLKGSTLALGDPGSPSAIAGSGAGWGLDLGLQWAFGADIRMATSLLDAIAMDHYHNQTTRQRYWEKRPLQWVSGLSWRAPYTTILHLDWRQGVGVANQEILALAFEKESWDAVTWKAGYKQWMHGDLHSWHAGLGARMQVAEFTLHIEYGAETTTAPSNWSVVRQTIGTRLDF